MSMGCGGQCCFLRGTSVRSVTPPGTSMARQIRQWKPASSSCREGQQMTEGRRPVRAAIDPCRLQLTSIRTRPAFQTLRETVSTRPLHLDFRPCDGEHARCVALQSPEPARCGLASLTALTKAWLQRTWSWTAQPPTHPSAACWPPASRPCVRLLAARRACGRRNRRSCLALPLFSTVLCAPCRIEGGSLASRLELPLRRQAAFDSIIDEGGRQLATPWLEKVKYSAAGYPPQRWLPRRERPSTVCTEVWTKPPWTRLEHKL